MNISYFEKRDCSLPQYSSINIPGQSPRLLADEFGTQADDSHSQRVGKAMGPTLVP